VIEIPLTKGYIAIIDDVDRDLADLKWHWGAHYAKGKLGNMHRVIAERMIGIPIKQFEVVDHINRNKLDNRRSNLRVVSQSLNALNRDFKPGKSGLRGVQYDQKRNKWKAVFRYTVIGWFSTKEKASEAYMKSLQDYLV